MPVDYEATLPRTARRHVAELLFVERLEPAGEELEDRDTARLVTRIQAGESELFAELYMRYFDRVYNYLRLLLNDAHEAEDGTQHVFTQVLTALPNYERRARPFRAWLFAIVRNHGIDRLRSAGRLDVWEPAEIERRRESWSEPADEPEALHWITDRELMMFIERLPLAQRQVLMLRYMLDLSHGEVAAILERSPEDVRILQHRALRFLEARLRAVGRAPEHGGPRIRMRASQRKAHVLRSRRFALSD